MTAPPPPRGRRLLVGVHARGTDAADRRSVAPVDAYLPYVSALAAAFGDAVVVYVASDDESVVADARWRALDCHVVAPEALRSTGDVAVFDAHAEAHHATNVEVLADILVLAHADLLLHAASAVAEAAQWLAFPRLHNRSVHLEFGPDTRQYDPPAFVALATSAAPPPSRSADLAAAWTLPPADARRRPDDAAPQSGR